MPFLPYWERQPIRSGHDKGYGKQSSQSDFDMRVGPSDKVIYEVVFEQDLNDEKMQIMQRSWGIFQADGIANVKGLKQEQAWCVMTGMSAGT